MSKQRLIDTDALHKAFDDKAMGKTINITERTFYDLINARAAMNDLELFAREHAPQLEKAGALDEINAILWRSVYRGETNADND